MLIFVLLLAISAGAVGQTTPEFPWALGGFYFNDNETTPLYDYGRQHPNGTRSINFTWSQWDSLPELTFRMNATHFRYPNPRRQREPIEDPHITAITFDFNWPGGGQMEDQFVGKKIYYNQQNLTIVNLTRMCQTFYTPNFDYVTNISTSYTEEDARSTDCRPFLGDECVNDWESEPYSTMCSASGMSFNRGAVCRSVLGQDRTLGLWSHELATNYSSGGIVTGASTGAMNGTNMTSYDAVTNRVHILAINPVFKVRGLNGLNRTSNIAGRRQLLCIRIKTGQAQEDEAEGAGTSTILGREIGGGGLVSQLVAAVMAGLLVLFVV
ncbi:hypothetical protein PspLS_03493 [Pyricularia sp. CBS 133598]|nr:hypothetical protein PspLS_03493 [Pyricularia sp. CBS 133598]